MSDNNLPGDLREVESALRSLTPQPARIDPARLLFLAGQESVRATSGREGRVSPWWRMATALSSALALTLAAVIVVRPQPEPTVVYRDVPVPRAKEPAQPESPPPPPAAVAEESRAETPARGWPPLVPGWLPAGGSRRQQLLVLQNQDVMSLASAASSGVQPVAQRELLDQYLRESGAEPTRPSAAAAFSWPTSFITSWRPKFSRLLRPPGKGRPFSRRNPRWP